MLYHLYETQRALMAPFSEFASASAKLYDHPLSPFAHLPMSQRVSAGFDLLHRLAKEYEKPEFGIRSVKVGKGVEVAVQEQVAIHKPFCRLLRFKRFTDDTTALSLMKTQPTVLVVAPLSGHHSTLLRDTVSSLLHDHKVYITDWTDARMVPLEQGPFHLDDYVEYVREFIRHIGPSVHVISVCQPTVPVLAAVSLQASSKGVMPQTMTMMGGPIDARRSPTAVNNLAINKSHSWFENNVIFRVPQNYPGAGRSVYPGFLQHTGFVAMNPDRHLSSHYDYFLDLIRGDDDSADSHRSFYDEYNAVLDMPAEYYLDTIKTVFQDFALVNGTWVVKGKPVRPQDISGTALLTVEGELDDISGSGQTKAAHDLCTGIPQSRSLHYDVEGAGHYGIFSGRRWREKVYPQVKAFIAKFNQVEEAGEEVPAKPAKAAAKVAAKAPVKAPVKAVAKSAAKTEAKVAQPAAKPAQPVAQPVRAAKNARAKTAEKAAQVQLAASAPRTARAARQATAPAAVASVASAAPVASPAPVAAPASAIAPAPVPVAKQKRSVAAVQPAIELQAEVAPIPAAVVASVAPATEPAPEPAPAVATPMAIKTMPTNGRRSTRPTRSTRASR